jgi:hypothetical protein
MSAEIMICFLFQLLAMGLYMYIRAAVYMQICVTNTQQTVHAGGLQSELQYWAVPDWVSRLSDPAVSKIYSFMNSDIV